MTSYFLPFLCSQILKPFSITEFHFKNPSFCFYFSSTFATWAALLPYFIESTQLNRLILFEAKIIKHNEVIMRYFSWIGCYVMFWTKNNSKINYDYFFKYMNWWKMKIVNYISFPKNFASRFFDPFYLQEEKKWNKIQKF